MTTEFKEKLKKLNESISSTNIKKELNKIYELNSKNSILNGLMKIKSKDLEIQKFLNEELKLNTKIGIKPILEELIQSKNYKNNIDFQYEIDAINENFSESNSEYSVMDKLLVSLKKQTPTKEINKNLKDLQSIKERFLSHQLLYEAIEDIKSENNVLNEKYLRLLNQGFNMPTSHVYNYVKSYFKNKTGVHPRIEKLMEDLSLIDNKTQNKYYSHTSADGRITLNKKLIPFFKFGKDSIFFVNENYILRNSKGKLQKLNKNRVVKLLEKNQFSKSRFKKFINLCETYNKINVSENKIIIGNYNLVKENNEFKVFKFKKLININEDFNSETLSSDIKTMIQNVITGIDFLVCPEFYFDVVLNDTAITLSVVKNGSLDNNDSSIVMTDSDNDMTEIVPNDEENKEKLKDDLDVDIDGTVGNENPFESGDKEEDIVDNTETTDDENNGIPTDDEETEPTDEDLDGFGTDEETNSENPFGGDGNDVLPTGEDSNPFGGSSDDNSNQENDLKKEKEEKDNQIKELEVKLNKIDDNINKINDLEQFYKEEKEIQDLYLRLTGEKTIIENQLIKLKEDSEDKISMDDTILNNTLVENVIKIYNGINSNKLYEESLNLIKKYKKSDKELLKIFENSKQRKRINLEEMKKHLKMINESKSGTYYAIEYCGSIGGHGEYKNESGKNSYKNFNDAYKDAEKFLKEELKNNKDSEIQDKTIMIDVSGDGDDFAILFMTKEYLNSVQENYFKDKEAYKNWKQVAEKVLETGKPQKGNYSTGLNESNEKFNYSAHSFYSDVLTKDEILKYTEEYTKNKSYTSQKNLNNFLQKKAEEKCGLSFQEYTDKKFNTVNESNTIKESSINLQKTFYNRLKEKENYHLVTNSRKYLEADSYTDEQSMKDEIESSIGDVLYSGSDYQQALKIYNDNSKVNESKQEPLKVGDLVWCKHMGQIGLVGLVVSDVQKDSDGEDVQDVILRGYNGETHSMYLEDMEDLMGSGKESVAIDRSDISMYTSIAKKKGIKINPKYNNLNESNKMSLEEFKTKNGLKENDIQEKITGKLHHFIDKNSGKKIAFYDESNGNYEWLEDFEESKKFIDNKKYKIKSDLYLDSNLKLTTLKTKNKIFESGTIVKFNKNFNLFLNEDGDTIEGLKPEMVEITEPFDVSKLVKNSIYQVTDSQGQTENLKYESCYEDDRMDTIYCFSNSLEEPIQILETQLEGLNIKEI